MGAPILSGLESGAGVANLLGTSGGSNMATYAVAGEGIGAAGTGLGVASSVGTLIHSTFLAGLSTGPIGIGALAVGAALLIVSKIFKGADPYNVPAAQTEQAFEGAAQNFKALVFGAYMSPSEASTAIQAMVNAGKAYYNAILAKLKSSGASSYEITPFQNGLNHMTSILQGDVQNPFSEHWPNLPLKPWNQSAAESLYIKGGTGTWYPASVDAATNLTNGYMSQLRASSSGTSSTSSSSSPAAALSTTKGKLVLGAVGAALLGALHFL